MCILLQCSSPIVGLLFPLCDTLKKDQTNYFLSPIYLSILYLYADLDQVFAGLFLCTLDIDHAIITEAYGIAEVISSKLEVGITSKPYDGFVDGLREDTFGNILYKEINADGTEQTIILNYLSLLVRHCGGDGNDQSKVRGIQNECLAVK